MFLYYFVQTGQYYTVLFDTYSYILSRINHLVIYKYRCYSNNIRIDVKNKFVSEIAKFAFLHVFDDVTRKILSLKRDIINLSGFERFAMISSQQPYIDAIQNFEIALLHVSNDLIAAAMFQRFTKYDLHLLTQIVFSLPIFHCKIKLCVENSTTQKIWTGLNMLHSAYNFPI